MPRQNSRFSTSSPLNLLLLPLGCIGLAHCAKNVSSIPTPINGEKSSLENRVLDSAPITSPDASAKWVIAEGTPAAEPREDPACTLASWEQPNEEDIVGTGFLTFDISNPDGNLPQSSVLVEVLMLAEDGSPMQFNTPVRDVQGILLELEPPLEAGETRQVEWFRKYLTEWASVDLQACEWLSPDEYWNKYPELIDNPGP
ncbi:MAG: hypothetical protein AAGD25_22355 [Cyanobacteria bacterium P01_F01_bin.150]